MFSKQSVATTRMHAICSNNRKGYLNSMVFELYGFHEPGDVKDQIAAIERLAEE